MRRKIYQSPKMKSLRGGIATYELCGAFVDHITHLPEQDSVYLEAFSNNNFPIYQKDRRECRPLLT